MRPTPIIFDWIQPINRRARARQHDPAVSHDAAARVELGKAERQRMWIFEVLKLSGPMSIPELARVAPYPDWTGHALGKRIGECTSLMPTGEVRNGSRVWGLI